MSQENVEIVRGALEASSQGDVGRTMIVSLEAIFLSTFVMISQNRADAKRQVLADQQWRTVQEEDHQNTELLDLSNQILELSRRTLAQAHGDTTASAGGSTGSGSRRDAEGKSNGA